MPQEKKTERERRKYLKPKKYEVFKKNKAARIREYRLKKKNDIRAITGQQCNINLRNITTQVFSIFNTTNFKPKCSRD